MEDIDKEIHQKHIEISALESTKMRYVNDIANKLWCVHESDDSGNGHYTKCFTSFEDAKEKANAPYP